MAEGERRPSKSEACQAVYRHMAKFNTGQVILDLFGGSGSTLIAAETTNRVCYMAELSPAFADVIINRWQNFTGQKAMHEEQQKTYEELKNGKTTTPEN